MISRLFARSNILHLHAADADAMRRRLGRKRGQGVVATPLDGEEIQLTSTLSADRLLEVQEALDQLEAEDEMAARIVRFPQRSATT